MCAAQLKRSKVKQSKRVFKHLVEYDLKKAPHIE